MSFDIEDNLIDRYPALEAIRPKLGKAFQLLKDSYCSGGKILTCGNGGSSADADHIVGELVKSFSFKRAIPGPDLSRLQTLFPREEADYIADQLEGALPAINLMSSLAFSTAYANDVNYEFAVAQHLYALGCEHDVLVAISTSGNSKNIVRACQVAKLKGIKIIALTGRSGGILSEFAEVAINVPADKVHEIQEFHLPIYHFLCKKLEDEFFNEKKLISSKTKKHQEISLVKPPTKNQQIELIVFDFDGVFTDNQVITSENGLESVVCNKSDSLCLSMAKKMSVKLLVLSKEKNPVVLKRCEKLGIELIQGCDEKLDRLKNIAKDLGLDHTQIAYMGNDLNDIECMEWVGFPISVADAVDEVKSISRFKTPNSGGKGAVRDAIMYLKNQEMIC